MEDLPFLPQAWRLVIESGQSAAGAFAKMLLSAGSSYSLLALGVTLAIAAAWTLHGRRADRPVRTGALWRALVPRRIWRSPSGRTDAAFAVFNIGLGMILFGWLVVGQAAVSSWVGLALDQVFGEVDGPPLPAAVLATVATVAIFFAYEFAYWLDHFLSHKLPVLWQFHQVHHSAESLSLATNFRVHPVDTIVFYNIAAAFTGLATGLCDYLAGGAARPFTIAGTNVLLLGSAVLLTHLHHTHFWIGFGERWGRVFLSPAHHQVHHSADPAHYDRNFGNSLAIFDRLFGTLYVPGARPEVHRFGVPDLPYSPHSFVRSMAKPFAGAGGILLRRLRSRRPSPPAAAPASATAVT
ncbi:sterol desaturase family protein [Tsuneonella sp. HG249]